MGIAVRGALGGIVTPLATKALLIHSAVSGNTRRQNGWGRLPESLEKIIACPDHTARILYQDQLESADYIRARIPVPEGVLSGNVVIRATLCIACETDPEHPGNYTRGGLDIQFRPNETDKSPGATHAKSKPFFSKKESASEAERREYKWETVLHKEVTLRGSGLVNPVFDIHCNAREQGHNSKGSRPVHFALVISVTSAKNPDFYNQVVRRYQTILEPLRPVLQVPIRTR